MGRRVRKVSHEHDGDDWIESEAVEDIRYIYDGWNLLMERDASGSPLGTTETVRHKYAWGLDLAGLNGAAANVAQASSPVSAATQGAGGIGGLLAMEDCTPHLGLAENPAFLYCYDGNGNVMQMVTWKDGDPDWYEVEPDEWVIPLIAPGFIAANYEYDPYGGTLLAQANFEVNNPFRFSTKYYDAQPSTAAEGERGLYYFGYRFFSERLGRWLTRDPIEYLGGSLNLVEYSQNNPTNWVDPLGLAAHWHHLLPKKLFKDFGITADIIDVNSPEYGWILLDRDHTWSGGIHPAGWTEDWRQWFRIQKKNGVPITRACIRKQLAQMLRNPVYIDILRKGFRAKLGYKAWKQWGARAVRIAAVQKLTNKLGRRAARKGGRAIPLLGVAVTLYTFVDDVRANGFWNATGEAVLDATPIVGTIKFGVDVTEGICDCFSEDEIDANIHEDLINNMDSWEVLIRILENDGFEAPSAPRPPVPLPFPKPGIVDQGVDCKRCH